MTGRVWCGRVVQSKWAPEELEARGGMVTSMATQIQELKETSLKGYVRNYQNRAVALVAMQDSEAFRGPLGEAAQAEGGEGGVGGEGGKEGGKGRQGVGVVGMYVPLTGPRRVVGVCLSGNMPTNTSMSADQALQLQQIQARDKDLVSTYLPVCASVATGGKG